CLVHTSSPQSYHARRNVSQFATRAQQKHLANYTLRLMSHDFIPARRYASFARSSLCCWSTASTPESRTSFLRRSSSPLVLRAPSAYPPRRLVPHYPLSALTKLTDCEDSMSKLARKIERAKI